MIGVKIGGAWAHGLGYVGDLEWSTTYTAQGGGLLTASFALSLPRGFTHPALRQGALVEFYVGSLRIGAGLMAEPDRNDWTFTVDGLFREAEHYVAVDSTGKPSTDLSIIVPQAISRGLPWTATGLPTGSLSTTSESSANLNTVADVLNQYAANNGVRWRIDSQGALQFTSDPTAPSWALTPGTPAMATADDGYTSRIFGRYTSTVTNGSATGWSVAKVEDADAAARWGVRETTEDITQAGLQTAASAQTILQAYLAAGRARPAYTTGVEVTPDQLTTIGGTPAFLPFVKAGQMVRHHGVLDNDGQLAFGGTFDWVIGTVSHKAAERNITVAPMGIAPRTAAQAFAAQQPRRTFQ